MGTDAARAVAQRYDEFGRRWARGTSPLYEEWAIGIGQGGEIADRIAALPPRQQQPNLLFAAARWAGCPLAPFTEVRGWLLAHWDEIVEVGRTRSVQTNEPNRCATLLPQLARIEGPIALLEVGTAAGLCLFPDRYSVRYRTPTGEHLVDPPSGPSPVVLACTLDDEASLPTRSPEVIWRRGIDLHPIDAGDPDAIAWLATLIWPGPDHDARAARLRAAASLVAAAAPEIVAGDLLARLVEVAASAPREATLVVFHSAVLLYLDPAQRRAFASLVGGLSEQIGRRVRWISNETSGTLPEIDAQLPAGIPLDHTFVQTIDGVPVALAGQHGASYLTRPFAPLA